MTDDDLVGQLVDGRYLVRRRIAAGGMGVVWVARQEALHRDVALKTLRSDDEKLAERFRREARALSRVRHENVVAVFDSGELVDGGHRVLFIAMELVEGGTLRERMRGGPLSVPEAKTILVQVLKGLAAAHAVGILHRDIKPENIMLDVVSDRAPAGSVVKLVDFGIARAVDAETSLTSTGSVVGTPGYTAPEVTLGGVPGTAADLYAVGALAYERFLTGAPVFAAQNALALAMQHATATPGRASARAAVPAALDDLIAALLAKDPKHRPSARDAVRTLEALAVTATTTTTPPVAAALPSLAPDAHTETVDAPTFQNPWLRIDVDTRALLVRVTRNTKKTRMEEIDVAYRPLATEPRVERARFGLLLDLRQAPPNNDDDFTARMDPHILALVKGYRRVVVLVRSAVGVLQVTRASRTLPVAVEIVNDEAKALLLLAPTGK